MPSESSSKSITKFDVKTAILVDGAFYRKRAQYLAKSKSPKDRANELERYCLDHLHDKYENRYLYRIFYYDCPPIQSGKNIYHPFLKKSVNLGTSEMGQWMQEFLDELKHRRKFALRLGKLSDININYNLKPEVTKELLCSSKKMEDLTENDFRLNIVQKGVDMRIGVDISSMAFKKQVNQIILIAGDSDFVPAAKLARREGIDFILDPMGNHIPDDLFEHIDGVRSQHLR
ncbi:MAG: NYN domain-containing protein [Candidatus Fimenecus sp.]